MDNAWKFTVNYPEDLRKILVHAHAVDTRPSPLFSREPGDEANGDAYTKCSCTVGAK